MLDSKGFDNWADDYDDLMKNSSRAFPFEGYYRIIDEVITLLNPWENLKILDVGMGTGNLSYKLYKTGCMVYGVDFSENMIKKAKEKMPAGFFEAVDISKKHFGNFNELKFDGIISAYFLHHLNTKEKILFFKKCVNNNLNQKGKIIIADIGFETYKDYHEASKKYRKYWDPEEYYLCGEEIRGALKKEGIEARYIQISSCGGIIFYFDV